MKRRKLMSILAVLSVAGVTGGAVAANSATAPGTASVTESQKTQFKPNRFIKDGLRWTRDVYTVKSGGTVKVTANVVTEGPHTFTIVRKSDLAHSFHCPICDKLGQAHGADPESNAPPKFQFLENGVGQSTPPNIDRPGDSGVTGPGKKGESISMKVTAKAGTTLYFMCIIHPWMQAKLLVK